MLKTKTFEIRDEGTFIPCIGTMINLADSNNYHDFYLMRRAGYSGDFPLVLLTRLDGKGKAYYGAYDWGDRTMQTAHHYIQEHWEEIVSGSVVDVQFILGETKEPKISESGDDPRKFPSFSATLT